MEADSHDSDRAPRAAIFLWMDLVDGEGEPRRHLLSQVSLSAFLLSLKIDPFRGGMEDMDLTPWDTACRELREESAETIVVREVQLSLIVS